ncbi:hypothetical protein Ddye_013596 [Dipteronia dyeriana]|uniref:RNase H type-1 domain-containing protein n=1 Tax=Dipteronia dyeriana TaxID=168575 RepID=A0AAE0CJS4_9ROSI|nr:hypothetical protein Ddye_013596 [Dipteronia dyeriana]
MLYGGAQFLRREGRIVSYYKAAEATTLLCGICGAVVAGLVHVIVESDEKGVVDIVNLGVVASADIGNIIADIHHLIHSNPIAVSFVLG